MKRLVMFPTEITQPNKNENSGLSKYCFKEVRRNGKAYTTGCRDQRDPKYHHQWVNTTNLLKGSTAQCGRASRTTCNHATYYSIKGYRNTCPIAGVTGTYNQPATLRLSFDLEKRGITKEVKVKEVKISLQHRCCGVDVGNSSETLEWGPNFYGFNHYPQKKVVSFQFVDKKGNPLSKQVTKQTNGVDFQNPPLSSKFNTITAVFTDVSYDDIKNGYLDIKYGSNLSTNPGNIFVKGIEMDMGYEDSEMYLEGTASSDSVYTSIVSTCRSAITYHLEAGYKQGQTKLSASQAPNQIQDSIYVVKAPQSVIVSLSKTYEDGKSVDFTLKDNSNIEGEKEVIFGINNTNITIPFKYTSVRKQNPTVSMPSYFEKNTIPDSQNIFFENGCASNIKIYLDNTENLIYQLTTTNGIDNTKNNIISEDAAKNLYSEIAKNNCGFHNLFIQYNDTPQKIRKSIYIIPVKFQFKFYIKNNNIWEEFISRSELNQDKENSSLEFKIECLTNKKFSIAPQFNVSANTYITSTNNNTPEDGWGTWTIPLKQDGSLSNREKNINIGLYRSGNFEVTLTDKTCENTQYKCFITITPNYQQSYDTLFVRAEGVGSLKYNYLTVLEGDNYPGIIGINNFQLKNSVNKIKFCSKPENRTTITETTTFPLLITNNEEEDIQNLYVELNALRNDTGEFKVTTDEWIEPSGMFYNFKSNFEKANPELEKLVEVVNLTKDNDFIDEENVYLKFNSIKANQTVKVNIPFGCRYEKEVQLQILLLENVMKIYSDVNCNAENKTFYAINLISHDSILTELSITGESDLKIKEGQENCLTPCFVTPLEEGGITYTAKNIDRSKLKERPNLLIKNDPRLQVKKIVYGNNVYDDFSNILTETAFSYSGIQQKAEDNATPIANQEIKLKISFTDNDIFDYKVITDKDGKAKFFITIPDTVDSLYSLNDLLEISNILYEGNNFYCGYKINNNDRQESHTHYNFSVLKQTTKITPIEDYMYYTTGETALVVLQLTTQLSYLSNEIVFRPNILKENSSDSITVYYEACRIGKLIKIGDDDKDNGILKTSMETNDIELMPNFIEKDLYCNIDTDIRISTNLTYDIIETTEVNKLYVTLINKIRDAKKVRVTITEYPAVEKYSIEDQNIYVEKGNCQIVYKTTDDPTDPENQLLIRYIYWDIDYIEKDTDLRGTFDFKATNIGQSKITVSVEDNVDFDN